MAYRRTKPLFIWIAAIPMVLLAVSVWRRAHYRELSARVEHSRQVQATIQDVFVSLADAETGRRGYIVTGEANYLAMLETSSAKCEASIRRLADLTRDNPFQQASVRNLDSMAVERLNLLKETSQFGGQEAAAQQERRRGLAASANLSRVAAEMIAEENRQLELGQSAIATADAESLAFLVAGTVATICLLLWAYRIIREYAGARDRAEADVRHANQQLQEKIEQLDRLNRDLEERVKERTLGLERSNQELQQFASFASHDLQEPLRMVSSYLGLLTKACQGKLDAEAEKYIAFAVEGATRMQSLVRDLLAYAQASTQPPVLARTRLQDVVTQARYTLLNSIRETGAEIVVGQLPEVEADPLKMSLVFQNLFSNAIKFRQPGEKPSIYIEARQENGEWRISVKDSGIGFDPKYAKKIFGAFQRLHGKDAYPGTGIGLAICSRIIETHGGRIWAEAGSGGGAIFHFTLPVLADTSSTAENSAGAAAFSTGGGRGV